mmetsp:Transcript_27090/g.59011  ORF Transcript_27090/g.59011 Transcript_27090/m.59011 type:complete len:118 (+) Transcript_27090:3-356(+)
MGRASQAIGSDVLTLEAVVRLFQNLVAPYGEDHPFSCVPALLTQKIGRPPRSWPFLRRVAKQLLRSWHMPLGPLAGDAGGEDAALTALTGVARTESFAKRRRLYGLGVKEKEELEDS